MAGRPRGLTSVVPVNDVLNMAQIRNKVKWRLAIAMQYLMDSESAIEWCARRWLIKNIMTCGICQQLCTPLNRYNQYNTTLDQFNQGIDGCKWACDPGCGFQKSLREGCESLREEDKFFFCWKLSYHSANPYSHILLVLRFAPPAQQ